MENENMKSLDIKLLDEVNQIEIGSVEDLDLMHITCFATHEGLNLNGTYFNREILLRAYPSFIEKPLVIVTDNNLQPTGHGFDFVKRTFDNDKRKAVGHIIEAYPVLVKGNEIENVAYMPHEDIPPEGELRIICKIVVYKHYLYEIASVLEDLHRLGELKFSMEGTMDCNIGEDGVKYCTAIHFTGLAIVKNPAFQNSYSLEVAEQEKGGKELDFEKAYNELKTEHETLVAEKAVTDSGLETKTNEVAEKDNRIEALTEEVAELKLKVEKLEPYKTQVIASEQKAIGEKRLKRLQTFEYAEKTAEELGSLTKEEYADVLEQAMDAAEAKKVDTKTETAETFGVPVFDTAVMAESARALFDVMKELV